MSGINASEIAARYGVNRSRSGRYRINEVCHNSDNGKKDLAIWDGEGGSIGAKCHSRGCSYQTILNALGVEFTYEGRTHHYGNGSAPVTRRRGPGKDLTGNPGSNSGLLVKLDAADAPEKTVVVVEGEKAFDALAAYGSKNFTAAHWVGGTGAADGADYTPLKGRVVILWPDAHKEGRDAMVRAGIMADSAGAAALQMVDTSGLPDKADAADVDGDTIRDLLADAEDWTPPPAVDSTNKAMAKGAFFTRDAEGLEAALLSLRLVLRSNVRGGRIEVRRQDHGSQEALAFEAALGLETDPVGWAHFGENAAAWCLNHFARNYEDTTGKGYKLSEESFRRSLLAMTAGRATDPVLEYFKSLPDWDGIDRLPTMFTDALGAPDTVLNAEAAKVLMIGLVERTYRPGSKHDEAPVLIGAQGGGKSTFCEELLPPEYLGWHRTLDNIQAEVQKRVERIDAAAIVEFAELRVLGGYGEVKNFLSDRADSYRLPYARQPQTVKRRWVGIATANDEGEGVLPDDPTGNRRYVAVKVNPPGSTSEEQSAHVREYLGKHRTQLWAEAKARYDRGEKSFLSGMYEKERDAMNTSYTRANQPLEQIAADITSKHADGEPVELADLMIEAGLARDAADAQDKMRKSGRKLAGYLTRLSWEKGRAMVEGVQKTLWTPPHLATPSEPDEPWPLCEVCRAKPVSPTKDSHICSGRECLVKLIHVAGGVDGEAARDAILHKLVVSIGKDCHAVAEGLVHYGIGPDWTHCYCGKYQRPEKVGETLINGQPSPEWVLHVSSQPPDERQVSLDGMSAPEVNHG